MYCKNCGQFLSGNENFCSNCGAKVEAPVIPKVNTNISLDDAFADTKIGDTEPKKEDNIKMMSHVDGITWDVKEFPTGEVKKTEDVNMSWKSDDMFLHNEIKKEKEMFAEAMAQFQKEQDAKLRAKAAAEKDKGLEVLDALKTDEKPQAPQEKFATIEIPKIDEEQHVVEITQPDKSEIAIEVTNSDDGISVEEIKVDEPKMTSVLEEKPSLIDEIAPSAIETLKNADIDEEKKKIDKFYTFNRKKEEFQKLLDKEYERIDNELAPGGLEEDISTFMEVEKGTKVEGTTQLEEMVKARTLFFDDPFLIPNEDYKKEKELSDKAEEKDKAAKEEKSKKKDKKKRKNKNKKLHETQEVALDDADKALIDEAVMASKENEEKPLAEEIAADNSFESEPAEVSEEANKVNEQQAADENTKEEQAEAGAVVFEPSSNETLAEATLKEETDAEPEEGKVVIEPTKEKTEEKSAKSEASKDDIEGKSVETLAKEFFDDSDDDYKKKGKKSRALIWILSIILVITTALLIIRIALPDTLISKQMDSISNKVIGFFSGDDQDTSQGELQEDKTGLIQNKISENYKESIGSIKYNSEAAYDADKEYTNSAISDATLIGNNAWYTDGDGVERYYDEELVGAVIALESQKVAYVNDGDEKVLKMVADGSDYKSTLESLKKDNSKFEFTTLQIGDIRVNGDSYFVWVIETINGKDSNKIYEFKEKDHKLYVVTEYDD